MPGKQWERTWDLLVSVSKTKINLPVDLISSLSTSDCVLPGGKMHCTFEEQPQFWNLSNNWELTASRKVTWPSCLSSQEESAFIAPGFSTQGCSGLDTEIWALGVTSIILKVNKSPSCLDSKPQMYCWCGHLVIHLFIGEHENLTEWKT